MKRFVLYLFFLSSFGNALTQELSFNTEKLAALDAFIIEEIEANRIAGAEVYIHHNGEAVWHKALGKSNSKRQTALKKKQPLLYTIDDQTHHQYRHHAVGGARENKPQRFDRKVPA